MMKLCKAILRFQHGQNLKPISSCTNHPRIVLGIETSCDDTGAAVVDEDGTILGEALNSQLVTHLENGGILPPLAQDLHQAHIENVVEMAMKMSGITYQDLSAVATTVKPGLPKSLEVGLNFSKQLVSRINKPFIPIHHMEAHALTVRAISKVEFPYLVLLASGGHCQIALVKGVDKFALLGQTADDAPGEGFDKVARRMKLSNLPECSKMSGGEAIEFMAKGGNPLAVEFAHSLSKLRDCNFSFSGIKSSAFREIWKQEKAHDIVADGIIPGVRDLCASFQHAVARHLARRLQRAMVFCQLKELLPENNCVLVASGGVLCNQYIRGILKQLCDQNDFTLVCPPPKLCTDNGIMIAWNGVERLRAGIGIADNVASVNIMAKCPLGADMIEEVRNESIKVKRFRIQTADQLGENCETLSNVPQRIEQK